MAFWNDFQKTVSKTAETGIKHTNKWLEIGKLTMSLNAAKLELNELFEQLGEYIYVNKVSDITHSDTVQELFHQVSLQKSKIRKIQMQINQVKQIRACEKCGAELDENAKYCPQCRAPQSDQIDWHL